MKYVKYKILGLLLLTIIVLGTVAISADTVDEYDYSSDFWQFLLELDVVTEGDEYSGNDDDYYMSATKALINCGVITYEGEYFSYDDTSDLWVKAIEVGIVQTDANGDYYLYYNYGTSGGNDSTSGAGGYRTIYYVDEDGTLLFASSGPYGTTGAPSNIYTGIPTKESTEEYTYLFNGWDINLIYDDVWDGLIILDSCDGYCFEDDLTITATYEAIKNTYTITFLDDDGSTISSEVLEYGAEVTIPADPIKDASTTFLYNFSGWTPDVDTVVSGNATYTATYTETPIVNDSEEPTIPTDKNEDNVQNDVDSSPTVLDKDEIIQDDINEELKDEITNQDESDKEEVIDSENTEDKDVDNDSEDTEIDKDTVNDPEHTEVKEPDNSSDITTSEEVQTGDNISIALLVIGALLMGIVAILIWRLNRDKN